MNARRLFILLIIFGGFALLLVGLFTGFTTNSEPDEDLVYGATFSKKYAEELGLDWKEVYDAVIDDMGLRHLRLSTYWDELEPSEGVYDFSWLDYQIDRMDEAGGGVVLAIGRRLPRWPECHEPDWAKELTEVEQKTLILELIQVVVDRYKARDVVFAWQVENEPLLDAFGECPPSDRAFYEQEVDWVRTLDSRPVLVTEPGELSTWQRGANYADFLGTSLYRIVWNPYIGYTVYPFTPGHYRAKAALLPDNVQEVWISELQLEPWANRPIIELNDEEMFRSMDLERMVASINFARRTGFSRIYFWGVEWWYYMKEVRDVNDFWDAAKAYIR